MHVRGTSIVNESAAVPEATAAIEKWVYGGDGLARVDGRVVLAPFTLPGEIARMRPGRGVHAELLEIVEASPERIAAPCPVFGRCGGCHYQHAPYELQLARKVDILREQLRRVGKLEYTGEIGAVSGPPFGYRNRVQLHIADGGLGYLAWRSHDFVPLDGECPIASPAVNRAIEAMRERLRDRRFPRFVRSLELFTNETGLQVNVLDSARPPARAFFDWCGSVTELEYATASGVFRVSPHSFFQVNRFLIDKLVEAALGGAEGASAVDLYAGVGLFALPLARRFRSVTAVESGRGAARDLAFNAARANAAVTTEQSSAEGYLAQLEQTPDFVLADPPRAGLEKAVVAHLNRLAPPRLAIVSCDPATLARDLAGLNQYAIERLTLIDLFPQTYHLETVAHLRRA